MSSRAPGSLAANGRQKSLSAEEQQEFSNHTQQLLTEQIQSLEKEVTFLRDSLHQVTTERDALDVELQQMHDTMQALEANARAMQLKLTDPTFDAAAGAGAILRDLSDVVLGEGEDAELQRAHSVLLAARNRRLMQVAEVSKSYLRRIRSTVLKVTGDMRGDLRMVRESFDKGAKGMLEMCRREFKNHLIPGIASIEVGSQRMYEGIKRVESGKNDEWTAAKPPADPMERTFGSLNEAAEAATKEAAAREELLRLERLRLERQAQQPPPLPDQADMSIVEYPFAHAENSVNNNNKKPMFGGRAITLDTPLSGAQSAAPPTPEPPAPPPPAFTEAEIAAINDRICAIDSTETKFRKFEVTVRRLLLAIGRDGEALGREWERIYAPAAHLPRKLDHAIASCDVAARSFCVTHLHPQLRALCQDRVERAFGMLDGEVKLLYDMMEEERRFGTRAAVRNYAAIAAAHGFKHGEIEVDENGNTVYKPPPASYNASAAAAVFSGDENGDGLGGEAAAAAAAASPHVTLHTVLVDLSNVHGCKTSAEELIARFRAISYKHTMRTFDFIRRLRYVGAAAVPTVLAGIHGTQNPSLTEFARNRHINVNNSGNNNNNSNMADDALMSMSRRGPGALEGIDSDGPVLCFCTSCKSPVRCMDCMHSRIFGPRLDSTALPAGSRFSNDRIVNYNEVRRNVAAVFRRYAVERLRKALIDRADVRTEHAIALTGIAERAKIILMMQRRGALPVLPAKALAPPEEVAQRVLIRHKELSHCSSEQHFTRARVAILERERQLRRELVAAVNAKPVQAALDAATKKAAAGVPMSSKTAAGANSATGTRGSVTGSTLVLLGDAMDTAADATSNSIGEEGTRSASYSALAGSGSGSAGAGGLAPTPASLMRDAARSWMPHLAMMVPVPPSALASAFEKQRLQNSKNAAMGKRAGGR